MPIARKPVVHKFGIISHSQRLQLQERLLKQSYLDALAQPSTVTHRNPVEISDQFVAQYNAAKSFDEKEKLDGIARKILERIKRKAGLKDGGRGSHVDLPFAWTDLSQLAQCKGQIQEDCLDVFIATLEQAPLLAAHLPALFYLAETSLYWLRTDAVKQPYLRSGEIKLLKMGELVFLQLFYHHMAGHLDKFMDAKRRLFTYLNGLQDCQEVYNPYPNALFSLRYMNEVGKILVSDVIPFLDDNVAEDEARASKKRMPSEATKRSTMEEEEKQGNYARSTDTLSRSVHDLSPTLWHSLDIWRCTKHLSGGLMEALMALSVCGKNFSKENWIDGVLAFKILSEAAKADITVLKAMQNLAQGIHPKPGKKLPALLPKLGSVKSGTGAEASSGGGHSQPTPPPLSDIQEQSESASAKSTDFDSVSTPDSRPTNPTSLHSKQKTRVTSAGERSGGEVIPESDESRDSAGSLNSENNDGSRDATRDQEGGATGQEGGSRDQADGSRDQERASRDQERGSRDREGGSRDQEGGSRDREDESRDQMDESHDQADRSRDQIDQSQTATETQNQRSQSAKSTDKSHDTNQRSQSAKSMDGLGIKSHDTAIDQSKPTNTSAEELGQELLLEDRSGFVGPHMCAAAWAELSERAASPASSVETYTNMVYDSLGVHGWHWEVAITYTSLLTEVVLYGSTSSIQKRALVGTNPDPLHRLPGMSVPMRSAGLADLVHFKARKEAADQGPNDWSWRVRYTALQGFVRICRCLAGNPARDGTRTLAWTILSQVRQHESDSRVLEALKVGQVDSGLENSSDCRSTNTHGRIAMQLAAIYLPPLPPVLAPFTPRKTADRRSTPVHVPAAKSERKPLRTSLRDEILLATAFERKIPDFKTRADFDLRRVVEDQWRKDVQLQLESDNEERRKELDEIHQEHHQELKVRDERKAQKLGANRRPNPIT